MSRSLRESGRTDPRRCGVRRQQSPPHTASDSSLASSHSQSCGCQMCAAHLAPVKALEAELRKVKKEEQTEYKWLEEETKRTRRQKKELKELKRKYAEQKAELKRLKANAHQFAISHSRTSFHHFDDSKMIASAIKSEPIDSFDSSAMSKPKSSASGSCKREVAETLPVKEIIATAPFCKGMAEVIRESLIIAWGSDRTAFDHWFHYVASFCIGKHAAVFRAFIDEWKPRVAYAVEASEAYHHSARRLLIDGSALAADYHLQLERSDLTKWAQNSKQFREKRGFDAHSNVALSQRFQLGIVFDALQYLNDGDLEQVMAELSQRVEYLWLSVVSAQTLEAEVRSGKLPDLFAIARESYSHFWQKADARWHLVCGYQPMNAFLLQSLPLTKEKDASGNPKKYCFALS